MRLSTAVSLLVISLSSCPTSAFGTPAHSLVSRPFGTCETSRSALCRSGRGGAALPLKASLIVEEPVLAANLDLLSERGRTALKHFIEHDDGSQKHVYADWPEPGIDDDGKRRLADQVRPRLCSNVALTRSSLRRSNSCVVLQLADLDASYPGGVAAYLKKAKILLKESADGLNPFSDFEASVPEGECLSFDGNGTMDFAEAERLGKSVMADTAFVLVAGGLGERLGYSGIKLSLESNLCTNASYLEVYVTYIQAMQEMARKATGKADLIIPLVIMTSGDTDPLTRQLLQDKNYFGMADGQIQIVMQDKVAALKDGNAGLALEDDDRWMIQTKPHGHGDVHHLLFREGMVDQWEKEGKKYVVFLQDTNALVINSVIPTLGVSVRKQFHMNSICIPRLAGEAAGAITRLE